MNHAPKKKPNPVPTRIDTDLIINHGCLIICVCSDLNTGPLTDQPHITGVVISDPLCLPNQCFVYENKSSVQFFIAIALLIASTHMLSH
jgi:hypothetical protein